MKVAHSVQCLHAEPNPNLLADSTHYVCYEQSEEVADRRAERVLLCMHVYRPLRPRYGPLPRSRHAFAFSRLPSSQPMRLSTLDHIAIGLISIPNLTGELIIRIGTFPYTSVHMHRLSALQLLHGH